MTKCTHIQVITSTSILFHFEARHNQSAAKFCAAATNINRAREVNAPTELFSNGLGLPTNSIKLFFIGLYTFLTSNLIERQKAN